MHAEQLLGIPLAVCVLPPAPRNAPRNVSYASYVHEILAHAGFCYQTIRSQDLYARLPYLRILLTVGDTPLPLDVREKIGNWLQQGGMWLSVGGTGGVPELFGVREEPPAYAGWGATVSALGEGYLHPVREQHPALAHVGVALHFFNGVPVEATEGVVCAEVLDAHQRQTTRAAIVEHRVGNGIALLLAPDLTGTVVRIQQGIAVTRDRVSAPDGTASVCDGVLKSSDGSVLDWCFDRQTLPKVSQLSAFLHPVADLWKEILIRALLYLAQRAKVALPILWLYPRNLPALAHLSHDTDVNDPRLAQMMLEVLRQVGVCSTWCVISPGYPQEIIRQIREEGHELAMHYDAMEEGREWSEQTFDEQYHQLVSLFGGQVPITNKNHYLRWEGDTEFYAWCQRRGIRVDQSKGPSKTGEAGFVFGTCHPYFPISPSGERYDVLELPTLTQDLHVFAPDALLEPLLRGVRRVHGVWHLLFHPAHIDKPGVSAVLRRAVEAARQESMEWWTAAQIDSWERRRRAVSWAHYEQDSQTVTVCVTCEQPLPEATILLAGVEAQPQMEGHAEPVERWGVGLSAVTIDLQGEVVLKWRRL